MSWFQELYNSYDDCIADSKDKEYKILPICHTLQTAHVEITINKNGDFLRAELLPFKTKIIMPATEDSAARTSGECAHGLADKIQYCAKDYPDYGGKKKSYFKSYFEQLEQWATSQFSNNKVNAIYEYVKKGNLVKDLIDYQILWIDENNKLLKGKDSNLEEHKIFKLLPKPQDPRKDKDQGDALIRWRVQIAEDVNDRTWEDEAIRNSWINFVKNLDNRNGLCYVTGEETSLSEKHPKNIYSGSSGAKLISANDKDGFTYRGRFENNEQLLGISFEVSQRAHAVLKYLLADERKQAYQNGSQSYVAWATHLQDIPKIHSDSYDLIENDMEEIKQSANIGQAFGEKLSKSMKGYGSKIGNADNIMTIGVDSATTGRFSIIYYKKIKGSDFLNRIEYWHKKYAWVQYFEKDKIFYGSPAPSDIAKVAYGKFADDKVIKKTVERLLPRIIDGGKIPNDIVENCIRQASNPAVLEHWQWQKVLGIACGLYKGNNKKEDYQMALDKEITDRNYLYGRLLAVIDNAESLALRLTKDNRETNAHKYMRLFSIKPFSTWAKLHEMFNTASRRKLLSSRPAFLNKIESILEEINKKFAPKDYEDNSKLNGNYLLGYYCQLADLKQKSNEQLEDETQEQDVVK
ncbi:MAG: type I-C CRISPR-associated protein Cas8c/Csd1 [Elusimicrobiota bacterium]|jgi:CRISPR-associated protein Csd1|nr:type I-C CRISPR-associated protein Cas8c/Csd1 [Elusimicrobiota bacterium]